MEALLHLIGLKLVCLHLVQKVQGQCPVTLTEAVWSAFEIRFAVEPLYPERTAFRFDDSIAWAVLCRQGNDMGLLMRAPDRRGLSSHMCARPHPRTAACRSLIDQNMVSNGSAHAEGLTALPREVVPPSSNSDSSSSARQSKRASVQRLLEAHAEIAVLKVTLAHPFLGRVGRLACSEEHQASERGANVVRTNSQLCACSPPCSRTCCCGISSTALMWMVLRRSVSAALCLIEIHHRIKRQLTTFSGDTMAENRRSIPKVLGSSSTHS